MLVSELSSDPSQNPNAFRRGLHHWCLITASKVSIAKSTLLKEETYDTQKFAAG
jgi:hypothetical protein